MNAFDLIVTVALGSTLATILLNKSVSLAQGLTAFSLLIVMQFILTWCSVRWAAIGKIVKSEPSLLLYNGGFLESAMTKERVTKEEVVAAIRESGGEDIKNIHAVVIETDGTLSVIKEKSNIRYSTLQGIKNPTEKEVMT